MTRNVSAASAPPNLISESPVVADVVALLRARGGQLGASEIADFVLDSDSRLPASVAADFIAELVDGDERFRFTADFRVELACDDPATLSLIESDFVVVDVETTGTRPPDCRVTEVGAYRVRAGQVVDEFTSLINPGVPVPPFISSLTGITNEMVSGAPPFAEIADAWLRFAQGSILVAHNAGFDMRFLNTEIARLYPARRMANPHLCTVALSRRLLPGLASHRLDRLADHFGVRISARHRAHGDALATAHILVRLLDLLHTHGARTLEDAQKLKIKVRA